MAFKPVALSLTAALLLSGMGCRQEAPTSPPAKPKTSAESMAPAILTARAESAEPSVGGRMGENVEDAVITGKVRAALLRTEDIRGTEINVETHKGVVQLNGFVPTNADLERAITLAKQVEGVKAVQNSLAVKSS
jgi:hyperosmotically inducible periplasmic protein